MKLQLSEKTHKLLALMRPETVKLFYPYDYEHADKFSSVLSCVVREEHFDQEGIYTIEPPSIFGQITMPVRINKKAFDMFTLSIKIKDPESDTSSAELSCELENMSIAYIDSSVNAFLAAASEKHIGHPILNLKSFDTVSFYSTRSENILGFVNEIQEGRIAAVG